MDNSEEIKEQIKSEFQFLIDYYGFNLTPNIDDSIYSEVRYQKNEWEISIKTTAYGTKVSLILISPKKEIGFIKHLFAEEYNYTHSLNENIKHNSQCLKLYGKSILNANIEQFEIILNELIERQLDYIQSMDRKKK